MNRKITRRKFAAVVGGAAVAASAGAGVTTASHLVTQQPAPPAQEAAKLKYGMTAEQEEQVRQAVERGARGRAALRNYKFEYADEPAFVFRAKSKR